MQKNRLKTGGHIQRDDILNFTFNGKKLQAYKGDTLASALLANDIKIVGRSFKYHRPRGIFSCGPEEPNAILQVGSGSRTEAGLKATQVELYDGLIASSEKGWPSLHFDVAIINDWLSKMFGAGFYYKTFMYPAKFWKLYEYFLRKMAGFGYAPDENDPDYYSHHNEHCDLLIVGAGPAGIMSALIASQSGANVIIVDEKEKFGGKLLYSDEKIDNMSAIEWVERAQAELEKAPNVKCLKRSTAFGYYDYNFLTVCERYTDHSPETTVNSPRQKLWRIRATSVVLAQGAFERPLVFSNNDRPGVMLASALSEYIKRFAVLPGRNIAIFTNNDSAYQTAIDLKNVGVDSIIIIDSRPEMSSAATIKASELNIEVKFCSVVTNVQGSNKIKGIEIAKLNSETGLHDNELIYRDCDLLAISGGWSPAVHLHSQSGGRNAWSEKLHCFIPKNTHQTNTSVGSSNGFWGLKDCLEDAKKRTSEMLTDLGYELPEKISFDVEENTYVSMSPLWRVNDGKDPESHPKQFIDYQNDTSVSDIFQAVREGYKNIEHVKRYTALGFGTDQGKLGNINGMAILAEVLNKPIADIGTTTFRPAYTPVSFGVCAGQEIGEFFDPIRKTAIHDFHENEASPFELVGQWLRPWYFPTQNETIESAVKRECLAVRNSLGIMDASTLGKIDVQGKDALNFLERIYTHDVSKMAIGQCAYGIMLGEDGMIKDDGVMTRVAENHFYLTTTTGGAATVMSWLEQWHQTEWPDLDVYLTSLTEQLSTIVLAGPNSRKVLKKLMVTRIDKESMKFMTFVNAKIDDIDVDVFRVSFSGELAFEINVDSNYALHLWSILIEAGKEYEITPYGTETMHVLRAEKGFIIVGQDTDGSVNPEDAGLGWMLSRKKDFIGKRSLLREDSIRNDRKQLVGLLSLDGKTIIPEGAQIIRKGAHKKPIPMYGHVSSSYYSPVLGHPIAMAMIESGRDRQGEEFLAVASCGTEVEVKVVNPVFYDPSGERQNVE